MPFRIRPIVLIVEDEAFGHSNQNPAPRSGVPAPLAKLPRIG